MLMSFGLFLALPLVGAHLQKQGTRHATNSSVQGASDDATNRGFSVIKVSDFETETVVRWNNSCFKEEEVVVLGGENTTLREVWFNDVRKKLFLLYVNGILKNCREEDLSETSIKDECSSELCDEQAVSTVKSLTVNYGITTKPKHLSWFTSAKDLRQECEELRKREQDEISKRRYKRSSGDGRSSKLRKMVILPGTMWCGPNKLAEQYKELGPLDSVDRCCRRHDHCSLAVPPFSNRYGYFNYMPFTFSHCACDQRDQLSGSRLRRSRRSGARGRSRRGIIPGTNWCGRGDRASKYTDLGPFSRADACCRKHDTRCPHFIPAFNTRYGYTNWHFSTLMHCACDDGFRACLKMTGSVPANVIGKIFFNFVQTECFVLKPQKVCKKWSRRGKCERYTIKKQAYIRKNSPY